MDHAQGGHGHSRAVGSCGSRGVITTSRAVVDVGAVGNVVVRSVQVGALAEALEGAHSVSSGIGACLLGAVGATGDVVGLAVLCIADIAVLEVVVVVDHPARICAAAGSRG